MFRKESCGGYPFERITEVNVRDGLLKVVEYLAHLLCIPSLVVDRNVIQVCVVDQGDRVACIGEAAGVKLDGNRQFIGTEPDIDGLK